MAKFKPSGFRRPKNAKKLSESELRSEYRKLSKLANARMDSIKKSGLYSPSVNRLMADGITRFGVKNQGIMDHDSLIRNYYRIHEFINGVTSTKTGIMQTLNSIVGNFNISFNGDYLELSQRTKILFDKYEDLLELERQGVITNQSKYDMISDLDALYQAGLLTSETDVSSIVDTLNRLIDSKRGVNRANYKQLNFNWNV